MMTVHNQADVQITVDPCLQSETTFDEQSKDTKLSTDLPPTSRLSVKWTEKQVTDVAMAEPAKQPLSILVEHEHLFSVGEGMLLIDSTFHYDIRFGCCLRVAGVVTCCVVAGTGRCRAWMCLWTAGCGCCLWREGV